MVPVTPASAHRSNFGATAAPPWLSHFSPAPRRGQNGASRTRICLSVSWRVAACPYADGTVLQRHGPSAGGCAAARGEAGARLRRAGGLAGQGSVVGRAGIEPATLGLRVPCSTS